MARKLFSYYGGTEFHNKMLKIFTGICLLQGGFFFLASFLVINKIEELATNSRLPADSSFYQSLGHEKTFLYVSIMLAIFLSTALFVYLGMRFSHEAVGAIYRIKKDFEIMSEQGHIEKLNLRKNDYFKDVEEAFNKLVQNLKK